MACCGIGSALRPVVLLWGFGSVCGAVVAWVVPVHGGSCGLGSS